MAEPFSDVKFFCLDTPAFEALTQKIVDYVKENNNIKDELWVSEKRACEILDLWSKTTFQKLRDTNAIVYSQTTHKHIVYETKSLYDYLELHSNRNRKKL